LAAIHLWAFKRRALKLAIFLAFASAAVRITKSGNLIQAAPSLTLTCLLLYLSPVFVMGSGAPRLLEAARRTASALAVAIIYGVAGFWLLEPHHLGQNFHWWQAA